MVGKANISLGILLLSGFGLPACAPNLKLEENKIELGKLQQNFQFFSTMNASGRTDWSSFLYFEDTNTGSNVALPDGNTVTMNGEPARYYASSGYYYNSGSVLPETFTVTWTFEGATYSNSVEIAPSIPSPSVDFSKSGPPSIELDLSREAVFYSNVNAGIVAKPNEYIPVQTLNRTTGIATNSGDLRNLAVGPGVLSVYQGNSLRLQFDTGAGGEIYLGFTIEYPVNIIE